MEFPGNFTGALGLCVFIKQHGSLIAMLSVGVEDAVAKGWPDITPMIPSTEAERPPGVKNTNLVRFITLY